MMNSNQHEATNIAEYDGHNFSLWKLGLFVLLEEHELIDVEFEDNDEDKNPTNLEEIQEWKRKDCKASGYILKTTKKTEQEILVDCTNANQMWNLLTAQHRERSADNQHDLLARFYDYKYKVGAGMKNHIADIKSIAHQLKEVGRPVDDREVMTKIISTLPVIYRPFVSSGKRECQVDTITSTRSSRKHQQRVCPFGPIQQYDHH
ncbi:hypothetical protein GHT06_022566 [Daphnia sinensis]|uniref:DUF4219 domain-containing protein n=1 Tax=Daphnia sinensis TaxID=1820382 RepID=A0AAD5KY17_9CRUS|nr:hypothetical protein GHT06_022566 [Daphnia sinensis]